MGHESDISDGEILSAFIMQFYELREAPPEIFVGAEIPEPELLMKALSSRDYQKKKIEILIPKRGEKKRLLDFAARNAEDALRRHLIERKGDQAVLQSLVDLFDLDEPPSRIEVYDNSHISGTNMVGAMIVSTPEGLQKSSYRKFNIREAKAADDFAMMREVFMRRFSRAIEEGAPETKIDWPDLVLIDGGVGQLNSAYEVLQELNLADHIRLVAVSKGPERNAGREKFHRLGQPVLELPVHDPVLHYLQRLRDEAHRFAIGAHRTRRKNQIGVSVLDDIPGIGAKRKKSLLLHFGSAKAVQQAGLVDLMKVSGVSKDVALKIYSFFHENQSTSE
jgi:excinuclease ABC subunit C